MLHYIPNKTSLWSFSHKRAIKKQMSIMALQIEFWTEEIDRSSLGLEVPA